MLQDNTSDHEPPKLYASKERALKELKKRFNETLNDTIYLTEEQKKKYKKEFKEKKDWFLIIDEPEGTDLIRKKSFYTRFCSVTKEYVY